ncbi:AAA family ATPase [Sphingomicrobium lutaoense]|uniref:Pilus assembly protein CpaE n=1 Tax=Sphingomicrobium lutaoense TaxID=515949 RepID=A0A839Z002_9SPHN|nr:hypothetical protein [Sphingomicrobium lutaoense]MBB3764689.1 pilus assembly protein CpaE [Sphingomicrobium lutaoense]
MSIMSNDPAETRKWRTSGRSAPVRLFLTATDGDVAALANKKAAGFPLELRMLPPGGTVGVGDVEGAAAAVIQLPAEEEKAVEQFIELARDCPIPLLAAAFDPKLSMVRALVRAGAHDVIPLPLELAELETSLQPIRAEYDAAARRGNASTSKMVTVIKAEGGVGATALLTQLATRFAANERSQGRECCLIDYDVQFGDAAFQLGLKPKLTLSDLIEAGGRVDGDLLRTVAADHPSGLKIISAPNEITPLEALGSDRALGLAELAMREFGTVFVDLPTNWTNWSLSMLARSDLALMICELTIPSLHRARRQLDLIAAQDLADLDVRVIVNRFEKGLFKKVTREDAERVLGRPVSYTLVNDHATMSVAIERGVPISEIRRRSPLGKDLDTLDEGIAATLGLER